MEVLENGAFFDVLLEGHAATRQLAALRDLSVEGGRAQPARDARRSPSAARAGVQVRVLVDANGGNRMGEAAPRELMAAGLPAAVVPSRARCATSACRTSATTASWW